MQLVEKLCIVLVNIMISIKCTGDFTKTKKFLKNANKMRTVDILNKYGKIGVTALRNNTPTKTGVSAASWSYKVEKSKGGYTLTWLNNNTADGIPVVLLLHYGHRTRNGGYVSGVDFINPALKPIFEDISNGVWEEVNTI